MRLSRIFYIVACLCCVLIVWPNPVTIFMAGCFSCLTLPVYRKFRLKADQWRRRIEARYANGRLKRFLLSLSTHFSLVTYGLMILVAFLLPFGVLAMLVAPQAAAGLARLRELQASKFQIPPDWLEFLQGIRDRLMKLGEDFGLEHAVNDFLNNIDAMLSDAVGLLVSGSFDFVSRSLGFVGSTMNMVWLVFLFLMLTIIFTRYARPLRMICRRILNLPHAVFGRFILAVHKALKAIMLGIVLVALVQGALCGIGFAVAGVNQPAFWGMLATIVAPIPMVGTALVWLPLCVSLWFTGKTMAAIGLGLWGALFVSGVDNVLRPFFLRQGIKAPFFVLILVILCGLSSFGAVGLILGPVLLALAMQALEEANRIYGKRR